MHNKHQRITKRQLLFAGLTTIGALFVLGGIAAVILRETGQPLTESNIGGHLVVIGVIVIAVAVARRKGRSIEEAYSFGYDLGYEMGWRERDAEAMRTPPGTEHRARR